MELENKSTIENEVVTVDITEGDYNDVYRRGPIVKGTWKQIEKFVQSYFSKEGLDKAEDISSEGYALAVYQELPDELTDWDTVETVRKGDPKYDELAEQCDQQIEYYVTADPVDDDRDNEQVIDLTKEES